MAASKRDFVNIAKAISIHVVRYEQRVALANELSDYFASVNKSFDREKFIAACDV